MTRWMWCCLGLCLTLFAFGLARYANAPQLRALAADALPALPEPRCPAQTLEADGVCVPTPAASSQPGNPVLRGALPKQLVKQLNAVEGWLMPLSEAPVPPQLQAPGQALKFTYAVNTPFGCPNFTHPTPRIETQGTDWLLLRLPSSSTANTRGSNDILLLLAGITPPTRAASTANIPANTNELKVGAPCSVGLSLGFTREFVTISARHVGRGDTIFEQFRSGDSLDASTLLAE